MGFEFEVVAIWTEVMNCQLQNDDGNTVPLVHLTYKTNQQLRERESIPNQDRALFFQKGMGGMIFAKGKTFRISINQNYC